MYFLFNIPLENTKYKIPDNYIIDEPQETHLNKKELIALGYKGIYLDDEIVKKYGSLLEGMKETIKIHYFNYINSQI